MGRENGRKKGERERKNRYRKVPTMQGVMFILVHAIVTLLFCATRAAPLPSTSAPLNSSEALNTQNPLRNWKQLPSRVTLSRHEPTTQPLLEDASSQARVKVCDSVSRWVTDKQTAIDMTGHNVTVLSKVPVPGGWLKQYFYETTCNAARGTVGGCQGVDQRYWTSECRNKQSYVRALTRKTENRVAWRWIQINTSCVCILRRAPTQQPDVRMCKGNVTDLD